MNCEMIYQFFYLHFEVIESNFNSKIFCAYVLISYFMKPFENLCELFDSES
jgi:hypothetical protein